MIRLFSISLFVIIIRDLPRFIITLNESQEPVLYAAYAVILFLFIISAVLWLFPLTLANKLLPKENEAEKVYWENDSILSIGFILMGVFLLYKTLSDLTYWGFVMLHSIGNNTQIELSATDKISIYVTFIEVSLSLFLIFGSQGISNLIMKFRGKLQ